MVTDSTTKARALPASWDSKNFVEEGSLEKIVKMYKEISRSELELLSCSRNI